MKTLMRDRRAGMMHSLIYYGFLVLFPRHSDPQRSIICCRWGSSSSMVVSTRVTQRSSTSQLSRFSAVLAWLSSVGT